MKKQTVSAFLLTAVVAMSFILASCSFSGSNNSGTVCFTVDFSGIDTTKSARDAATDISSYKIAVALYDADTKETIQSVSKETTGTSLTVSFDKLTLGKNVYVTAACTTYSGETPVAEYTGTSGTAEVSQESTFSLTLSKTTSYYVSSSDEFRAAISLLSTVTGGKIYVTKDITIAADTSLPSTLTVSLENDSHLYLADGVTLYGDTETSAPAVACTSLISTANGLAVFATMVNNGYTTLNAQLLNDIDLSSIYSSTTTVSWTPIGNSGDTSYNGIFDGAGHTVSNLYISKTTDSSDAINEGFFANTGSSAVIRNTALSGTITVSCAGILCVGGICAVNSGTIVNCLNSCSITGTNSSGTSYVAGIAAYVSAGLILNCANTGKLSTSATASSSSGDGASFSSSTAKPGAIVGNGSSGAMYDCYWLYNSDMAYDGYYSITSETNFPCSKFLPYNTTSSYFQTSSGGKITEAIDFYTLSGEKSDSSVAVADATDPGVVLSAWVTKVGNASGSTVTYHSWTWDSSTSTISFAD